MLTNIYFAIVHHQRSRININICSFYSAVHDSNLHFIVLYWQMIGCLQKRDMLMYRDKYRLSMIRYDISYRISDMIPSTTAQVIRDQSSDIPQDVLDKKNNCPVRSPCDLYRISLPYCSATYKFAFICPTSSDYVDFYYIIRDDITLIISDKAMSIAWLDRWKAC